jgi:hypothetical protein
VTATTVQPLASATAIVSVIDTPPSVAISNPANGAVFPTGAAITLSANASDDSAVTSVAFYADGTLLSTLTAAPYSMTWTGAPTGSHSLTAVATDNAGLATTSAAVNILVDTAPTASVTSPANNSVFVTGSTVTLSAGATDSDGSVSKVDFFAGATLVGTAATAPFNVAWVNPASGTYAITAKATDNAGLATTSAAVTVIIDAPPTCAITSPANNSTVRSGSSLTIKASASDSDGTVASVTFYDNGTSLKVVTTAPYQYSYTPSKGTHVLTAKATDNRGVTTTSSAITITAK